MISIIIPSHNDIYLAQTINSLLWNAESDIEIIPVLDGYKPRFLPIADSRVRPVFHKNNRGMRESINTGVENAKGKYLMRVDEHCMFNPGYDRLALEEIEDNWIVNFRRHKLDPISWKVISENYIDYEKLLIVNKPTGRKFSAVIWKDRTEKRKHILLDEDMAMQGSCWVMSKYWWDKVIGRLQSKGYGTLYQDTTEMLFKTWKAGGKLMLNKKTWYAHKHRKFNRTHHYSNKKAAKSWKYALGLWEDYYQEIRKKWGV